MKVLLGLSLLVLAVTAENVCKDAATDDPCGDKEVKSSDTCTACSTYDETACGEKTCKWESDGTCTDMCPSKSTEVTCVDGCDWTAGTCDEACSDKDATACEAAEGCEGANGECKDVCAEKLQPACEASDMCSWAAPDCNDKCTDYNDDQTACEAAGCLFDDTATPECTVPACAGDEAACGALGTQCFWDVDCEATGDCADADATAEACMASEGCLLTEASCDNAEATCPAVKAACDTADNGCEWEASACTNKPGTCSGQTSENDCCARDSCKWVECEVAGTGPMTYSVLMLVMMPFALLVLN